jgi:hypothetical protein
MSHVPSQSEEDLEQTAAGQSKPTNTFTTSTTSSTFNLAEDTDLEQNTTNTEQFNTTNPTNRFTTSTTSSTFNLAEYKDESNILISIPKARYDTLVKLEKKYYDMMIHIQKIINITKEPIATLSKTEEIVNPVHIRNISDYLNNNNLIHILLKNMNIKKFNHVLNTLKVSDLFTAVLRSTQISYIEPTFDRFQEINFNIDIVKNDINEKQIFEKIRFNFINFITQVIFNKLPDISDNKKLETFIKLTLNTIIDIYLFKEEYLTINNLYHTFVKVSHNNLMNLIYFGQSLFKNYTDKYDFIISIDKETAINYINDNQSEEIAVFIPTPIFNNKIDIDHKFQNIIFKDFTENKKITSIKTCMSFSYGVENDKINIYIQQNTVCHSLLVAFMQQLQKHNYKTTINNLIKEYSTLII